MKKFKRVYIEITNNCNLSCGFCPKTKRGHEFMNAGLFRHILENIKGVSEFVYFHVMGEPLMHPQLGDFLDMCGEYGYKVNLTTNGTLIGKSHHIIGKPALRQVNISLHSNNDPGNKYSGAYLDGIFDFVDASKDKTLICLRLWNLSDAKSNEENMAVIDKISAKYAPDAVIGDKPTHVRGIQIAKNIFINQSRVFEWPDLSREDAGEDGFCYGLREQIGILVDGTVVPCCLDKDGDLNLGNIRTDSLENIINSPRARAIYDGFSGKKAVEPLCKKCGYRTRFK
jgi:radical SAM protein with 4Fe4S-binding SPASM domain